jgi:hypothetical protein
VCVGVCVRARVPTRECAHLVHVVVNFLSSCFILGLIFLFWPFPGPLSPRLLCLGPLSWCSSSNNFVGVVSRSCGCFGSGMHGFSFQHARWAGWMQFCFITRTSIDGMKRTNPMFPRPKPKCFNLQVTPREQLQPAGDPYAYAYAYGGPCTAPAIMKLTRLHSSSFSYKVR